MNTETQGIIKNNWDDLLESLSTWKKWNVLLEELKNEFWKDIILALRKKWDTPRGIAETLKVN
jgi:hypothetical protein